MVEGRNRIRNRVSISSFYETSTAASSNFQKWKKGGKKTRGRVARESLFNFLWLVQHLSCDARQYISIASNAPTRSDWLFSSSCH